MSPMAPMAAASSMAALVSSVGLIESMYSCLSAMPTAAKSSRSLTLADAAISSNMEGKSSTERMFWPNRSVSRLMIMLRR